MASTGLAALSGFEGARPLDRTAADGAEAAPGLLPAAFESGEDEATRRLLALNRPEAEDDPHPRSRGPRNPPRGVDYRRIDDEVGSGSSLAAEVWRAFLVAMALALLAEAILCLPPKPDEEKAPTLSSPGPDPPSPRLQSADSLLPTFHLLLLLFTRPQATPPVTLSNSELTFAWTPMTVVFGRRGSSSRPSFRFSSGNGATSPPRPGFSNCSVSSRLPRSP